jgi:diacylglycerol kinase family enzyme
MLEIICATPAGRLATLENVSDSPETLPELKWSKAEHAAEAKYELSHPFDEVVPRSDWKISVVVSILSGTRQAKPFFDQVLKPLLDSLCSPTGYEVEFTRDANTVSDLTKSTFLTRAQAGTPQLIIILSGDGGIVDIINSLGVEKPSSNYLPPEVALIPMGTGNALANSSGIAADGTMGLSTLTRGTAVHLPTIHATFSPGARVLVNEGEEEEELPLRDDQGNQLMYGAVVGSWGLHASLVADSDTAEYRKFGVERFSMAAKENLYPPDGSEPHHYKANISILNTGETEWTSLDRKEHAYVLATLVSNLEKGFTISPSSEPLSGKLRVVHFGPMPGDEVMRLMTLAYQGGKHVEDQLVTYQEVDGIRISFDGMEEDGRWRRICLDGKIIRIESDGWVEIRPETRSYLNIRHLII